VGREKTWMDACLAQPGIGQMKEEKGPKRRGGKGGNANGRKGVEGQDGQEGKGRGERGKGEMENEREIAKDKELEEEEEDMPIATSEWELLRLASSKEAGSFPTGKVCREVLARKVFGYIGKKLMPLVVNTAAAKQGRGREGGEEEQQGKRGEEEGKGGEKQREGEIESELRPPPLSVAILASDLLGVDVIAVGKRGLEGWSGLTGLMLAAEELQRVTQSLLKLVYTTSEERMMTALRSVSSSPLWLGVTPHTGHVCKLWRRFSEAVEGVKRRLSLIRSLRERAERYLSTSSKDIFAIDYLLQSFADATAEKMPSCKELRRYRDVLFRDLNMTSPVKGEANGGGEEDMGSVQKGGRENGGGGGAAKQQSMHGGTNGPTPVLPSCIICRHNVPTVTFAPCGHQVVCFDCIKKALTEKKWQQQLRDKHFISLESDPSMPSIPCPQCRQRALIATYARM